MAYTEIVITKMKDHLVSMLLKDHQPVEFQCVSEKAKIEIGNIYTGIVKNVVKNINGAFVEFDEDEMGFLSMQHKQYKAGDEVLVQIKKEATKEKRPMLSDQIELTGKYLVLTSDKLSVGISNKIHKKDKNQGAKRNLIPTKLLKTAASYIRNAVMVTPCGGWGYAPALQAGERAPLGLRGLGEDFDFSP